VGLKARTTPEQVMSASPPRITVLLADDHSLVRRGFRRILEDDPGIAVVGEAQDGDEVIQLARRHKPQVIVMDCAMPGTNGVAATRQILRESPDVAILMLSMHAEDTLCGRRWRLARADTF
jgi:two-component system response regulator DegU